MDLGCLRAWGWKRQRGHRNPACSNGECCGGQCHIIVFINRSSFILKLARASVPSFPIRRLFQSLIPLLVRNNVIAQIYSRSVQSHLFLCQYCSLAQTALLSCTMGSRFQFLWNKGCLGHIRISQGKLQQIQRLHKHRQFWCAVLLWLWAHASRCCLTTWLNLA